MKVVEGYQLEQNVKASAVVLRLVPLVVALRAFGARRAADLLDGELCLK